MRKIILPFLTLSALLLSALPVAAFAEQAIVTGNEVNVRSGPGTAYGIFASLDEGKTVEVIDRSDADWYLISWDGSTGYVSSQFLALTPEESPAQAFVQISVNPVEAPGYISGMYVSFRSGPNTSSTILGTFSTGKTLTITGSSGEWTAVRIDGKDGFVFSQYVKEGSPNAAVIEDETSNLYGGTPFYPVNGSGSSQGGSTVFVVSDTPSPTPEAAVSPELVVQVPTDGSMHPQDSNASDVPAGSELIVSPNGSVIPDSVTEPAQNAVPAADSAAPTASVSSTAPISFPSQEESAKWPEMQFVCAPGPEQPIRLSALMTTELKSSFPAFRETGPLSLFREQGSADTFIPTIFFLKTRTALLRAAHLPGRL